MLNQPFFQSTLPIMITIVSSVWAATFIQNKRFDDLKDGINKRLDEIITRLDRIEKKLDDHEKRISLIEGRLWK